MSNAATLQRPRLDEDIVPFTEYRRTLNDCFARSVRTHRPIIITQNGRATFATMSISDLEATWDEIEAWRAKAALSHSVALSRKQFANGECLSEEESFDDIENMLDDLQANGACK